MARPAIGSTATILTTRSHSPSFGFALSAIRQSIERSGSYIAITDRKVHPDAHLADKIWQAVRDTIGASETDLKIGIHRPGYRFRVLGVEVFCSALTGTVSVDVKIGTVSVLNAVITPTAGARVAGTLATALASRVGSSTEDINVEVTTAATSSLDDVNVTVVTRPYPVNQEVDRVGL